MSSSRAVARKTQGPEPADLLAWYDRHRRRLPWRALPGVPPDPYAVWLSEIMLQQTTVTAVKPYFETFLARWPTVADLAASNVEDVMTAWAGLGYYARARNLHKCARVVAEAHGGIFPDTEEGLRDLPGIGPYTAAAIAAIAFGRRAVVVDGNVERVMARLFGVTTPLPKGKPELIAYAGALTPAARAGDYAQAVMDLGATICTPKSPACALCPWSQACIARARGIAETLPAKLRKAENPTRYGIAFWMVRKDGAVLLRRREAKGLLGGMTEVPSTAWRPARWTSDDLTAALPFSKGWRTLPGVVTHTFTHFPLELTVMTADLNDAQAGKLGKDALWTPLERLDDAGLPSVMRKVARHAMKHMAPAH
ncbi:MAG: A/G-specific adenine glycosylase [Rhodospirillaceae bacterium]